MQTKLTHLYPLKKLIGKILINIETGTKLNVIDYLPDKKKLKVDGGYLNINYISNYKIEE